MSFKSFFIFLLCLSMHACNAKHLGHVKVMEKVKVNMGSIQKGGTSKECIDEIKSNGAQVTLNQKVSKEEKKHTREEIPGLVPIKHLVSESWRVGSKNHDDQPGFYSDYSRPHPRPPSHN